MEVFNLATKEMQDAIKQDTTDILSNFPILNALEGTVFKSTSDVDITGKGVFIGFVNTTTEARQITIILDGVEIPIYTNNGSTTIVSLPFKNSFKTLNGNGINCIYSLV